VVQIHWPEDAEVEHDEGAHHTVGRLGGRVQRAAHPVDYPLYAHRPDSADHERSGGGGWRPTQIHTQLDGIVIKIKIFILKM